MNINKLKQRRNLGRKIGKKRIKKNVKRIKLINKVK